MSVVEYQFALIGYPLAHSRSPQMHQAALEHEKMRGTYRLFPIEPGEGAVLRIANSVNQLRHGYLHGINITIPYKQTLPGLVDCLSDVARGVGAVNTLVRLPDHRILGDNTDVAGFMFDLQRNLPSGVGKALLLGAGGAARAVAYGLAQAGWQVQIAARRLEQAAALAQSTAAALPLCPHPPVAVPLDAAALARHARGVDLLVNSTPVGMHPDERSSPWPEDLPLPAGALVYDLIYNPPETRLLQQARAQGSLARNGAGMLAAQGAQAFHLWTGKPAPFDVMERALRKSLST